MTGRATARRATTTTTTTTAAAAAAARARRPRSGRAPPLGDAIAQSQVRWPFRVLVRGVDGCAGLDELGLSYVEVEVRF